LITGTLAPQMMVVRIIRRSVRPKAAGWSTGSSFLLTWSPSERVRALTASWVGGKVWSAGKEPAALVDSNPASIQADAGWISVFCLYL